MITSRIDGTGASIAVLAAALLASAASAQTAAPGQSRTTASTAQAEEDRPATAAPLSQDMQGIADIVVTGSKIRGVAPIGSNLVSVGIETIEKTAPVNVSQLVNTVPSISTAGSLAQGENGFSYYSPQIHSLAGSSSNTTLVIVDGLRLPGGGTQFNQTDPNIIPVSAIQRVEVLADGASSVYGSDAVAGVVNFITRRTFDGLEANVQAGFADHYRDFQTSFIWGKTWETGGVYVAGSYSDQSKLLNKYREFSSRGDYRSVGGSVNQSYQCNPATIVVPGVTGVFLSPSATTPVANTTLNAPCNNSIYATLLPSQFRANSFIKVTNDFSDKLTVTATMNYNRQETHSPNGPGGLSNAVVFGPGSGRTGQINPFYVAPAGAPTATQETVSFLFPRADGEYGESESQADSIYATAVADYKITDDWTVTLSDAFGWNRSALNNINSFCSACALLALNGTGQSSGSTTATNIAGQNVIALNLPLTTANALDIWSPVGSANRTSAAVLRSLYGANSENTNYNTFNQIKLDAQGSLFNLPGGAVKIAVGGEYYWQEQTQKISGSNGTGPTTTGSNFRVYNYDRNIKSVYAELYVPVISPEMEIPFFHRVDLSIAGRYDKFSDVGDTTNPKFAANWEPFEGLKLRGNYSRSFVAPPIGVIGDPTQGYLYASGSVGVNGAQIAVPIANYPTVAQIPGIQCTATTCLIGTSAIQGMRRQLGGGFTNEVPQKGRSWSLGADFAPRFLPGFVAAATFFHNTFIGGVSSPSPSAIVNSAGLRPLLTICPSGCTQAQIESFANIANGATISGAVPPTVYFLIDQSSRNALNLKVEGIDAQFTYKTRETGIGRFTVGTALTYFTKFVQNFGGGTSFSILNTSGYNTTFPSVRFKNRAQLGWESSGFSADLFWNHTGSYRNWISTSVNPITVDSVGNPTGGGDKVKANNLFDMHLQYTFKTGNFLNGWQLYVDMQNIFDRNPPFYNGNTGGILGGAWGYNGFVSNPLGRLTSFGLRVKL
ncbi:TonB-dependent receptor [Sphingomonas sp.]|uniref:TonB-dependent receptor domain-containing protein n=1 Tax=Sphingomonas sp. TaxID=28214 RepID=UPI000DB7989D|nr:TonB-dependent receptor [Sphingomonas sp.]PZU08768.1 MAG: TonB-dependent receptor [Sphingomonas sp.]